MVIGQASPRPREHGGEDDGAVPEVLEAQVLVRRVLVVVVVRDGQAQHGHAEHLGEQVHGHAAAQGRQADDRRPPRLSTSGHERARERRVHVGAGRRIAGAPLRACTSRGWARRVVERRRLVRRSCSPAPGGGPRSARGPAPGVWSGTSRKSIEARASVGIAFAARSPTAPDCEPAHVQGGQHDALGQPGAAGLGRGQGQLLAQRRRRRRGHVAQRLALGRRSAAARRRRSRRSGCGRRGRAGRPRGGPAPPPGSGPSCRSARCGARAAGP